MAYVDGYVLPVAKGQLPAYRRLARRAGKLWRDHGALEYRECVGDDLGAAMGVPFTRTFKLKPNEVLIFSWVVFASRAHRDRVNAKVMKDPWIAGMKTRPLPFNPKRMNYGGFKVLVEA